jgi:integrase
MAKSINIILQKQFSEDRTGIVYIRTIENNVIRKKSLGMKLLVSEWERYFNTETKRFRNVKEFSNSSTFNDIIEKALEELGAINNEISNLPSDKLSFVKYWEVCIKNMSNHGSKIKHDTVLKKLKKYLGTIDKKDLRFVEITPLFLKEYKNYLLTQNDPKILSNNSVVHYLKMMRSIINQAKKDDFFTYIKDPFNSIEFNVDRKSKAVLSEDEVDKLLSTRIGNKVLKLTRDLFLFQVFSNGCRVSDLFLFRWNNLSNGRLSYTMFKTGTEISIPINTNMGLILSDLIEGSTKYETIVKSEEITFVDDQNNFQSIKLKQLDKLIDEIINPKIIYNRLVSNYLNNMKSDAHKNMGDYIDYKGYTIDPSNKMLRQLIDVKQTLIDNIEHRFLHGLFEEIKEYKKQKETEFIFPVLLNEDYKSIGPKNDFKKLTERQYKLIKHHTIVYNRNLKKVQELCGIETKITSHVSRHSFTNLLLRLENVNLYDISQSLGHSSLKITENYLRGGFNIEKIDYLNNTISKKYRKSK